MAILSKHKLSLLLLAFITLIAYFSIDAAKFSRKCSSDGCLGIYLLYGIALTIFIIQCVVLIGYSYKQRKTEQPFLLYVLVWFSASLFAIFIPLIFTNILKLGLIDGFLGTLEFLGVSVFMVLTSIIQSVKNWL
jgi:hypothetical protein